MNSGDILDDIAARGHRETGGAPAKLSVSVNFIWSLLGLGVFTACQFGMLAGLAKVGTASQVGQFSLGLAIASPILFFSSLGLRVVVATDVKNEYTFGEYSGLRFTTSALGFLVILIVALTSRLAWVTAGVVIIVGLAKTVETISDIIYGLFQKHERMEKIAISMMLRGIGSVVALIGVLALTHNILAAISAMAGFYFICFVLYDSPNARVFNRPVPEFNWSRLLALTWLTAPIGISAGLISLTTSVPRYFVQWHLHEAALGYFSALAYVGTGLTLIFLSLAQAILPRLSNYYLTNIRAYLRLFLIGLVLAAAVGVSSVVVFYFFGREIITVLYKAEYARYIEVMLILLVGNIFYLFVAMLGASLAAARYFRTTVLINIAYLISTVAACYYLVPAQGLKGAAIATAIGNAVQCAGAVIANVIILIRAFRKGLRREA